MLSRDNWFVQIPFWVLEADISAKAVRLYGVLLKLSDNNSKRTRSVARSFLAKEIKVESEPTVDRAIAELEFIGAIKKSPEYAHDGSRIGNAFQVITTAPKGYYEAQLDVENEATPITPALRTINTGIIDSNNLKSNKPLTKVNGDIVHKLMAIYMKNFEGEIKPSKGQTVGQIKVALKQLSPERMAELLPLVACEGQPVTLNTLLYAANNSKPKKSKREKDMENLDKLIERL